MLKYLRCLFGHSWCLVTNTRYQITDDVLLMCYGYCAECDKRYFTSRFIVDDEVTRMDWK